MLITPILEDMQEGLSIRNPEEADNWAKELAASFRRVRHLIGILRVQHQEEWLHLVQLGKELLRCTDEYWTPEWHVADEEFSTSCRASCITHQDLIHQDNRCLFRNLVLEFCMNN
jgi:hypothetical protein